MILQHILLNNNPILNLTTEESEGFFRLLLNDIQIGPIFTLLLDITKYQSKQDENWFETFNSWAILVEYLSPGISQAFYIACYFVNTFNKDSSFIKTILSPETLPNVINIALTTEDQNTSELAFKFLINAQEILKPENYLLRQNRLQSIDILSNEDDKTAFQENSNILPEELAEFTGLLDFIKETQNDVAGFIVSTPEFVPCKRMAIQYMLNYDDTQMESTEAMYSVLMYLNNSIINYPTNDFLAISYVECFKSIATASNIDSFDIKPVIQNILSLTANKKEIVASFWGCIDKIARIINKLVLKETIPQPDEWPTFLTKYLIPRDRTRRNDYGGFSRANRRQARLPRYYCVDEEDMSRLPVDFEDYSSEED
ncbi:hypothetical protein TVAGG3_0392120 [Trichomonas vaginalis G3]|uniref:hypothetical protein n=1 Tax=Trichomonas vaginalis (strain ATCC PRA-98 / G3) TaxID=412133 RepID=UPI0021E53361|nr:hypothetical protein TVAGG3_0392120 [Trichomonas vaginalis G3]KAI5534059.1 hypothetical protein TVAGG3_0392120 [Trichomonas vaginalis G3]